MDRRTFLHTAAASAGASSVLRNASAKDPKPTEPSEMENGRPVLNTDPTAPNILIVMADDLGPWALGCTGNGEIRTPNVDSLAAEGIRFTNFFCASPVCSPARASFLTGRIPSQHGIHDWIKSGNISVDEGFTWSGKDRPVEYLRGMDGFTDVLARNGYACGLSGKWHLGDSARPQKGYSYWYAYALGGGSYVDYHAFENTPEMVHKTQYVTDYFTNNAIAFLEQHVRRDKRPFCLSLHYTAPHSPWTPENHPQGVLDMYANCPFESVPSEPPHPWGGWKATPEQRRTSLQGYFAAVTAMDTAVGRVLKKLDDLGIRKNTLVVFLSDNGMNMGHHGICGKGNGTFPLNMYDTSVKIPFIVSWPGRIPRNAAVDGLYCQADFRPTILEFLGFQNPGGEKCPGRSFAPVLRGKPDGGRTDVVVVDEYGPVRMIRDHEWKYVHRYPYGPHELYSLSEDPGEKNNRIDDPKCRNTVIGMRSRLEDWFLQYVDPSRDGARQAVYGKGQIDEVGPAGKGRTAFLAS